MDGLNKMCVFSAVIKPASGSIIRRGGMMRSEKRSLAINEMKEVLKSELVTKICGGRVWVVRTEKQEDENGNNLPVETRATNWGHNQVTKKRGKGKRDSQSV